MSDPWAIVKHFVRCYYCKKAVNATEAGVVHDDGPRTFIPERTTLVSCDECGGPLVFRQYQADGDAWDDMDRVWPGAPRRLSWSIPKELRQEHAEATKCLEANAFTAVVVMVRRTLEGVAALHGIAERNLMKSLAMMQDSGALDPRLVEWSKALRVLGNEGAREYQEELGSG
ncbi:DUF4145 domain-containing protein [Actinophytocola xinjiangensis]|uniref:DUF4145 domain-containing protein n=1 Tax=Actinophytocola xinjiangensis TaxID=485602 RepID=UPI0012B6AFDB|nr:DUF4145 domain-containing protein [Actinophytocola xinjiangensis]